jgi:hypothetical protein
MGSETKPAQCCCRLFRRREILLPTWQGWLALLLIALVLGWLFSRFAYSFFALTERVPARILVVEGWIPDYAFQLAVKEVQQGKIDRVYVTGIPLDYGAPLSAYRTYAEVGAAILVGMGLDTNQVVAVPAQRVKQDRTYMSAVYLARYFQEQQVPENAFNIISMGAHARRSRMLFRKAFGDGFEIGVISVPYLDFDPKRWYTTSAGVRGVISEVLAYGYARLLFWPKPESSLVEASAN